MPHTDYLRGVIPCLDSPFPKRALLLNSVPL